MRSAPNVAATAPTKQETPTPSLDEMASHARRALDLLAGAATLTDQSSSRTPIAIDAAHVALLEARAAVETLRDKLERAARLAHESEVERRKLDGARAPGRGPCGEVR